MTSLIECAKKVNMQEKPRRVRIHNPQGEMPIGVSTFEKLKTTNCAYVDKTLLILEVVERGDDVVLLTRPRRFGKTVNLDMLRCFLEKPGKSEKENLFAGLLIGEETEFCAKHQGKYPVIYVSFKDAKKSTWASGYKALRAILQEEVSRHVSLCEEGMKRLPGREQEALQRLAQAQVEPDELERTLKLLCKLLAEHYGKKPYVLIDEYDAPMIAAYQHEYYAEMRELMRTLLSQCLKDNPYLGKGVMTGILRVAKEDIFSGLNNLGCYGVMSEEYSEWFGFTPEEVHALLKAKNLLGCEEEVQTWYNGYRFGKTTVYNPWSVVNFVRSTSHEPKPYWINTSDNALIRRLLTRASLKVKQGLEELLQDGQGSTEQIVQETVPLQDLENHAENVWGLLLSSGYLTRADSLAGVQGSARSIRLQIPNREVRGEYESLMRFWLEKVGKYEGGESLVETLLRGDIEAFGRGLSLYVQESLSYFDVALHEPEKVYQSFVLGMMQQVRERYYIRSERESGWGRYDLMLEPKDKSKLGVVLEFKRSWELEQLQAVAQGAVQQIKDKGYSQELFSRGVKSVLAVGLAFCGKQLLVKHETLALIE